MSKSNLKSIDQARAAFAWGKATKQDNKDNKEYYSIVNKVPALIKTNGLLNTIAFLYKDKSKNHEILEHIKDWLCDENYGLIPNEVAKSKLEFMNFLLKKDSDLDARFLIQCTSEVLALFNWLRRFATKE